MSQLLIFGLLAGALIVPVLGAVLLRLLADRLPDSFINGGGIVLFAIAIASVLVLVNSQVTSLSVGGLTLLLPLSDPVAQSAVNQPPIDRQDTPIESSGTITTTRPLLDDLDATAVVTATDRFTTTSTITSTATSTITPTTTSTATITAPAATTPTQVLPATEPLTPTTAPAPEEPTELPPESAEPQTYTLQPGDALFDIAAQFNVSVEQLLTANNLTEDDAQRLQPGDEIIIP